MKVKILLTLLLSSVLVSFCFAQTTKGDTTWIPGGTFAGSENAGLMETTINNDIDAANNRIDPKRVYALYEGQVYTQLASINVNNPTGTLTIVGVPDPNNPTKTTKPIIVLVPTNGTPVSINNGATTNQVYGSVKLVNIHYQAIQIDGTNNNELFMCGTANNLPQRLDIDKCLFEFSNIDLFDCTNESGAIGGWPNGATFKITNSYFRNLFQNGQWWGCRVFQCKHPTDTCWIENCTVTTGGLTFLQQNELTDVTYINHNTIINNKKYWLLSPYKHIEFITNNIFVNQNWVGEDTNVTNSGQDPDKLFMSTINIDTNTRSNKNGLVTQSKYWQGGVDSVFTTDLDLKNLKIYVSNNINYYGPELISGYYKSSKYLSTAVTPPALVSYIAWNFPGPTIVHNVPGEWMNTRTKALFSAYTPAKGGGFVEENTITTMPQTTTPITLDAGTVDAMAQWNQNQFSDPAWPAPLATNLLNTKYIYGDYDPTTLPGIINGAKSDAITQEAAGTQVGIRTFTDLSENFYQTANMSSIDQLPIGSLIWNDAALKAFNSKADFQQVIAGYRNAGGVFVGVQALNTGIPASYTLSQNYPNPFNPTTNIKYSITKESQVSLKVYDIIGRLVETLVNAKQAANTYEVNFNASKLASGVYIYRLEAGDFVQSMKMMLIK
jgi:hypothetical protein